MRLIVTTLFTTFALSLAASASTINVPADYPTIQGAVDAASDGDEIIVAPGTYTSTQDGHVVNMKRKAITLRSSNGPEVTIIDGQDDRRGIACVSGENKATVIEGFTITNGDNTWYDYDDDGNEDVWEDDGGGIICSYSNPTFLNCRISSNTANGVYGYGGGIFCWRSSPILTGCTIKDNTASYVGGGISIRNRSYASLVDCTIESNTADAGAGIDAYDSSPTISDCTISGNSAGSYGLGGGIYWYNQDWDQIITISGCTISNNTAKDGGGIFGRADDITITDCKISNNTAYETGGGIWLYGNVDVMDITITNCTISGNTVLISSGGGIYCNDVSNEDFTTMITNCTITGNTAPGSGGGIWGGHNTLTNTTICSNEPDQVYGKWNDEGGSTVEDECPNCSGDATGDFFVDVNDVLYVLSAWGSDDANADFDENGLVDVNDVLILLSQFGEACP